jgi:hypothetical protein
VVKNKLQSPKNSTDILQIILFFSPFCFFEFLGIKNKNNGVARNARAGFLRKTKREKSAPLFLIF